VPSSSALAGSSICGDIGDRSSEGCVPFFGVIHRSAWKENSANFALTEISEVNDDILPSALS
jgi:hypothetical protein